MNASSHIGIFDSGIGGITVLKALKSELPLESYIYLADSKNSPYGRLSTREIIDRSIENAKFLLDKKVKLIVVACNTATGVAIEALRDQFAIPFIGMEPAVKPAASNSSTKKIGVLATARTFEADHYNNTVDRFASGVEIFVQIGDGLVDMIESGRMNSPETEKLLASYLHPMVASGIDQLVLGCTHYPLLIPIIKKLIPDDIAIHDPAPAVARQTRKVLGQFDGLQRQINDYEDYFFSTGDRTVLDQFIKSI